MSRFFLQGTVLSLVHFFSFISTWLALFLIQIESVTNIFLTFDNATFSANKQIENRYLINDSTQRVGEQKHEFYELLKTPIFKQI